MTARGATARRALVGIGLVVVALLLGACARTHLPQDTFNAAGPAARREDGLWWPVFWIAAGVFFLVEGLLVYALWRFRHRPGRGVPTQIHGNKRLEIAWTMAPALLLAGVAVPTVGTIFSLAQQPTGQVVQLQVTGHQWWWEVRYPQYGVLTANEIHIPAGRPVNVSITSKDVIHSFWVPRLAGKQDLEPGRTNRLTIEADRPGVYLGQCAEYCGTSHANMRFRVIAESEGDFQAWVTSTRREVARQPSQQVLAIMQRVGCGGCHTIGGLQGFVGNIGPNLTHFGARTTFAGAMIRNTGNALSAWLRDPQAVKPGNDMTIGPGGQPGRSVLTDAEISQLVSYLESLK